VVRGDRDLAEAIAGLARADQVEKLMRKHSIGKGIATQIALGDLDLEDYLLKQRLKAYLVEHRERSMLTEFQAASTELLLATHGQVHLRGVITEMTPYDICVDKGDGELEWVNKLQLKFVTQGDQADRFLSAVESAEDAGPADPVKAPQDRYHLADRHLMSWMEEGKAVCIRTREGELLHGNLEWFSRWELGLLTRDTGLRVGVFRHAIAHLEMD